MSKSLSSYSSILSDSETETITDSTSTSFARNNQHQTLSAPSTPSIWSNRSHTTYFFRTDVDNPNICYCKICETNFAGTNKTAHGYSRKGGNTSNLIGHLRDKHNINKDNYLGFLDEQEEVFFKIFIYFLG